MQQQLTRVAHRHDISVFLLELQRRVLATEQYSSGKRHEVETKQAAAAREATRGGNQTTEVPEAQVGEVCPYAFQAGGFCLHPVCSVVQQEDRDLASLMPPHAQLVPFAPAGSAQARLARTALQGPPLKRQRRGAAPALQNIDDNRAANGPTGVPGLPAASLMMQQTYPNK
jgi:hypothetical protein